MLPDYGQTGNLDDPGAWLFIEWFRRAPGFTAGLFSDTFDPSRPLNTPWKLNTANPAVLQALAAAVKSLRDNDVPLNATLRQTQHAPQSKATPIHGCAVLPGATAANGTPGHPRAAPMARSPRVLAGADDGAAQGRSPSPGRLAPSQATDPTSPWYANLTRLFSKKRWVELRFTARELARDTGARRTHVPGAVAP